MRKTIYGFVLLFIFLIVSVIYIQPSNTTIISGYRSSELRTIISKHDNSERVDYTDASGKLAIAVDLGYATCVITQTENGKLESYYDDKGKSTNRKSGYYAVLHEYDNDGNNVRNTYLDQNGALFSMPDGYAIDTRKYDQKGRITEIRYFDKDNMPCNTYSYGYGRINEYDENGNNIKISYIDLSGKPMLTRVGYASVIRSFYNTDNLSNGKIEYEFYFDEKEQPIELSLGQYGVHKEYDENGQNNVQTYLDSQGNPIITKKGYTTIKWTFYTNNDVETERYYDINNKPFQMLEGQYGIKKNLGRITYLDKNGRAVFNLKNFLYNQAWIAIIIAIIIVIVTSYVNKLFNYIVLIFIIISIFYLTLFFRDDIKVSVQLEPFWSYKKILYDSEMRSEIIKNIWLFIPLGAVLCKIYPKQRIIYVCIAISMTVEIVQYFECVGLCEIDDVISNGLGGWIGFEIGKLTKEIQLRIKR